MTPSGMLHEPEQNEPFVAMFCESVQNQPRGAMFREHAQAFTSDIISEKIVSNDFLNHVCAQGIFLCFVGGDQVDRRHDAMSCIELHF